MPETSPPRRASPWTFVPSLNVLQGVTYFAVQAATNTYLSVLELAPSVIGKVSSDATLPFMFKALWSPLVDLVGTKRGWILGSAVAIVGALAALAWACTADDVVTAIALASLLLATAAATNDVATDGFYIVSLDRPEQEAFVGVRSACFRIGRLGVMYGAVSLAGWFATARGASHATAYAWAFGALAGAYALTTLVHAFTLPRVEASAAAGGERARRDGGRGWSGAREAIVGYFARPGLAGALAFILLYRLAELVLSPMIQPFLLASRELGGLGLPKDSIGDVYGKYGVLALVAGGMLGGYVVARFGLRRCLWPMALAMHVPNVLYAWAAHVRPDVGGATAVVAIEQFGYGLGFSAYMAVLLAWSRDSRYATTHYAISTGIMGFTAWAAGRWSGVLVERVGYEHFFWWVTGLGLVGLLTLPFAPTGPRTETARPA